MTKEPKPKRSYTAGKPRKLMLRVRLDAEEWKKLAELSGGNMSEWVRQQVMKANGEKK